MSKQDHQVRLQVAKQASYISGEELKRHFHGDWRVEDMKKGVVEADRASRESMLTFLSQVYPEDTIWGKGMGELPKVKKFWLIDSLNGGENYGTGESYYATTVAWIENGEPILGVVSNPSRGQLFSAVKNSGAQLNNVPLKVRETKQAKDAYILASFGHGETRATSVKTVEKLLDKVRQIKIRECPALEICAIAQGTHDAFIHHGFKPWDWVAAQLIVNEAGGTMSDLESKMMMVKTESGLVSNSHLHNELLKIINSK
ncbi:inositol monophosphatase family protein [Candidatus Berkelbacteria bacterium]|nr:inositol monophosphatase family protein [Candidatus Berkelbacteria bacterium]